MDNYRTRKKNLRISFLILIVMHEKNLLCSFYKVQILVKHLRKMYAIPMSIYKFIINLRGSACDLKSQKT